MDENSISREIIGAAIEVHRTLGPGLLESAYQECLARELTLKKLSFEREKPIPIEYKLNIKLGILLNFNVPLMKEGIKRLALKL